MTRGEWFSLPLTGLPKQHRPEFRIRPCPNGKRKELLFKHYGHKQKIRNRRVKEGGESYIVSEHDLDNETAADFALELGVYVLEDVRGLELEAAEAADAEVISKATGEPCSIGMAPSIDGHLTDDLKRHLYENVSMNLDGEDKSFLDWVIARSDQCGLVAAEAEEMAGKT